MFSGLCCKAYCIYYVNMRVFRDSRAPSLAEWQGSVDLFYSNELTFPSTYVSGSGRDGEPNPVLAEHIDASAGQGDPGHVRGPEIGVHHSSGAGASVRGPPHQVQPLGLRLHGRRPPGLQRHQEHDAHASHHRDQGS